MAWLASLSLSEASASTEADIPTRPTAYLLDNGNAYHIAHAVGILEHVLEDAYLPLQLRKYKHMGGLILVGMEPCMI